MPEISDKAIVLKHHELSGADKVVTFLTESHGKLKAAAKGARRPKNRFSGSLEPLSRVELVCFVQPEREVLARLNQCEVVEPFDALRENYDRLMTGLYLLELADSLLKEGVPMPNCFTDLGRALEALAGGLDRELVRWGFTWRLLKELGYSPSMANCVVCRSRDDLVAFNPGLGGCLCGSCRSPERDGFSISAGARESLGRLGDIPWPKFGRLSLTGEMRGEVARVVEAYLLQHLDRQLKSAAFLE